MSDSIDWAALREAARAVRGNAHAPYSEYQVGAALITRDGRVFSGCNVENATYGLTICAERSALASMVAAGASDPVAIAIVTPGPPPGMPCGMCRQSLAEFAIDLPIHVVLPEGDAPAVVTSLNELLPKAFRPTALFEAKANAADGD